MTMWKRCLTQNWHLLTFTALMFALALFSMAVGGADAEPSGANAREGANGEPPIRSTPERPSTEDRAFALIERHEETLRANPDSMEAPAVLSAMGNVYRQRLGDYAAAARCYELILVDYPDWPQIRTVYPQLLTCYQQMGEYDGVDWVYEQMLNTFPEGSEEHLFALTQLGH